MIPILATIKGIKMKRKDYSRVLSNKMTIVAWELYKTDRRLHLAFIIHRLRFDFGFNQFEIANFTGMPIQDINELERRTKKILDSEVLKILANLKEDDKLKSWYELPDGHGKIQGYRPIIDYPAWYLEKQEKKYKEPFFKLGSETEKDYEKREANR